ncbi:MAG: glycosyltransferase family 2 protein [Parvularculaceae bacterium]
MDDSQLIHFDRLRRYLRAGRAPWRREADRLIFLTTQDVEAAPDLRVRRAEFQAKLRERFAAELTREAISGLATRAPADSARVVLTQSQKSLCGLLLLLGTAMAVAAPHAALSVAYAALALAFSVTIGVRLMLAATAAAPAAPHPRQVLADDALPVVTILVPLFREANALPGLVAALRRLDYPAEKLDIKLLLEERDLETIAQARRLNEEERLDLVIIPASTPQTKPKALNYALHTARGDLVVIYDAEDEPEPAQLRLAAETFAAAPDDLACVQARLSFYNAEENWLTRLFTLEYCLWFDHFLPALDRIGAPVPLGGTSNIFRADALIDAGGWDPHNVTEDADLGLRLARRGWRTAVIDSTTYEEANCALPNWIRQRSRWMKGFMQTWLVHRRRPPAAVGWKEVLTVDLFIGGAVASALAAPWLWALSAIDLAMGAGGAGLLPSSVGAAAIGALAIGNVALIGLAAAAPVSRGLSHLAPWALFMPVYWLLMAGAAYVAAFQLVTRPHYWEKTDHGLSTGADARRREALRSLGFD